MHDHNLDDLIIDNIEPKNSKTKSLLTIIALLIVVLIVAIILTKILLKAPNENRATFEESTTELIAPELKLQEKPKSQEAKEELSLSKMIESKSEAPVEEPETVIKEEKITTEVSKEEPVLSNIQDQEIKAPVSKTTEAVADEESKEEKDAADIAYWEAIQEKRKAEKIARETATAIKPAETKKEKVPAVKTVKTVALPAKKVVKKPVVSKPVTKSVTSHRYYVQVGSFRKQPSPRFVSVIRNNGFRYTIQRSAADGMNKLLIGPYTDRESANSALIKVRDRIHKSAFIVKR